MKTFIKIIILLNFDIDRQSNLNDGHYQTKDDLLN